MSRLKNLIAEASQKSEMRWRVYAYDPAKDNKLVHTSEVFDCIDCASKCKYDWLAKHPTHTIEIVSESIKKEDIDDDSDVIVKPNEPKNESGVVEIEKLGPTGVQVWKGPQYKQDEYMVTVYGSEGDYSSRHSMFHNPKNKSMTKQDAITYAKKEWPNHRIVVGESTQKSEAEDFKSGEIACLDDGKKVEIISKSPGLAGHGNYKPAYIYKVKALYGSGHTFSIEEYKLAKCNESAQKNEDKQSEELDELIYHIRSRAAHLGLMHAQVHDNLVRAIKAKDISKIRSILSNSRSYTMAKEIVDSFNRAIKLSKDMKQFSLESAPKNEAKTSDDSDGIVKPDKQTNEAVDENALKAWLKQEHSRALSLSYKKANSDADKENQFYYRGYASAIHEVQRKLGL